MYNINSCSHNINVQYLKCIFYRRCKSTYKSIYDDLLNRICFNILTVNDIVYKISVIMYTNTS